MLVLVQLVDCKLKDLTTLVTGQVDYHNPHAVANIFKTIHHQDLEHLVLLVLMHLNFRRFCRIVIDEHAYRSVVLFYERLLNCNWVQLATNGQDYIVNQCYDSYQD
jgi:hypothetical protein